MVVLADEVLESFFETDLSASFQLQTVPEMELPVSNSGLLGDLWSSIATDSNKKIFNMFTDEIGKTIGKHQVGQNKTTMIRHSHFCLCKVVHRPSIGRYTKLEEPKARESLLTPSMKKSPSKSSLRSTPSTPSLATSSSSSTLTVNIPESSKELPRVPDSAIPSAMSIVQAANAALMERTAFAIDDAKDDDDDEDDDESGIDDNDDQVMDEVCSTNFFRDYLLTLCAGGRFP